MKLFKLWFPLLMAILITGCDSANREIELNEELDELRIENRQLNNRMERRKEQIAQLKKQIKTLSDIHSEEDLEKIYDISDVKIGSYTDLYDKDKDGVKEKLIVYIQPTDIQGDTVKAPAKVQIQLWDLQKSSDQAKLKQWDIPAEKLSENWFSSFMLAGYRLKFDVSKIVEEFDHPLTVKVEFTDCITGKTFNQQKVIKPDN